jgi:hypothetical protein
MGVAGLKNGWSVVGGEGSIDKLSKVNPKKIVE